MREEVDGHGKEEKTGRRGDLAWRSFGGGGALLRQDDGEGDADEEALGQRGLGVEGLLPSIQIGSGRRGALGSSRAAAARSRAARALRR